MKLLTFLSAAADIMQQKCVLAEIYLDKYEGKKIIK